MTWTLKDLLAMVVATIRNPREGAATLLSFTPRRDTLWQMLALVVVLSVLMAHGTAMLFAPMGAEILTGPFNLPPFTTGVIQGSLLVIMVFATHWIGRMLGGTGSFEETLLLLIWLQFVLVVIQVVQTVALVVLPPLAPIIGILAMGLFFWMLTNFIAVLHGFASLGMVFVGILMSAFAIIFGLSLMLTLIGITVPGLGDV